MIIIKSQDGLIVKSNKIKPEGTKIFIYQDGYVESENHYKSKERAEEVVDMIEEHIRRLYVTNILKKSNNNNATEQSYMRFNGEAIFIMPKE